MFPSTRGVFVVIVVFVFVVVIVVVVVVFVFVVVVVALHAEGVKLDLTRGSIEARCLSTLSLAASRSPSKQAQNDVISTVPRDI